MHKVLAATTLISLIVLGCQKNSPAPAATEAAPVPEAPAASATTAETANKQNALDYATMENEFLTDARGQWAVEASATSTFGESRSGGASDSNKPRNLIGKPDGQSWTNDNQDLGFDSIEATFARPVHATEVRAVFNEGITAVAKLELRDVDGKYQTVWSGLSEDKRDRRGPRDWFVRRFEKSAASIQGVRITIANTVERGYKKVDAVQLVGD